MATRQKRKRNAAPARGAFAAPARTKKTKASEPAADDLDAADPTTVAAHAAAAASLGIDIDAQQIAANEQPEPDVAVTDREPDQPVTPAQPAKKTRTASAPLSPKLVSALLAARIAKHDYWQRMGATKYKKSQIYDMIAVEMLDDADVNSDPVIQELERAVAEAGVLRTGERFALHDVLDLPCVCALGKKFRAKWDVARSAFRAFHTHMMQSGREKAERAMKDVLQRNPAFFEWCFTQPELNVVAAGDPSALVDMTDNGVLASGDQELEPGDDSVSQYSAPSTPLSARPKAKQPTRRKATIMDALHQLTANQGLDVQHRLVAAIDRLASGSSSDSGQVLTRDERARQHLVAMQFDQDTTSEQRSLFMLAARETGAGWEVVKEIVLFSLENPQTCSTAKLVELLNDHFVQKQ